MRCPSCGGVSHPATGSVLPSGEVVCGPCVRSFWSWASEHGKKTYRVGKKGKGSKYIAFPTGITRKNPESKRDCTKCGGTGYIPRFGHYAQGVCFDCGGTGVQREGSRGRAMESAPPLSDEERIKLDVWDLRTMWHNFVVSTREGSLDEYFLSWADSKAEQIWYQKQEHVRPTVEMGKEAWLTELQGLLDELRKLGAGKKADEIARQFQSRLRVPVKNRRRTSRRRTSRRPHSTR